MLLNKHNLSLLYFITLIVLITLLFTADCKAQLTKSDIKTILELQGSQQSEAEAEILYNKYLIENSNTEALIGGIAGSILSGVALGSHESFTFNYTNSGWLPDFLENWYKSRPNTEAVFGKLLSWQKIWRDVDYASDRYAYNKWKLVFKADKLFSYQTLLAYITHWIAKNTFATLIRDKFKHGNFFYSFNLDLIIP